MLSLSTATVTAHIISNAEITLTECGRMLATVPDTTSGAPVAVTMGDDVALWDDSVERPRNAVTCLACSTAYMAL